MTPLERAARALCSLAGNPENAKMGGKPLWMGYLPEARTVRGPIDRLSATNCSWCAVPMRLGRRTIVRSTPLPTMAAEALAEGE